MKKILKVLVPVLVLAMLLQVPFAMNASASALSQDTSFKFTLTPGEASDPGNVKAALSMSTDENELITTIGATIVVDATKFDLVNNTGAIVTDQYKVDSKQVGADFGKLTATQIGEDEEDLFVYGSFLSLVSYNATNEEFYIFISGLSASGLEVPANSEVFTFFLQAKDGVKPSDENVRVMALSEYKNAEACPAFAIAPGAVGSKSTPIGTSTEDVVTDVSIVFDFPSTGSVSGAIKSDNIGEKAVDVTVTLANTANTYTTTTKAEQGYAFSDVEAGTYTITISAPGSLGFTINNVVVTPENTTEVPEIYLLFGDCNEDGTITAQDISNILTEFGESSTSTSDVDGSGTVTAQDIGVIILANHFGISASSQIIDLG